MEGKLTLAWVLILCIVNIEANGYYYKTLPAPRLQEKTTNLHFFFHDTLSGKDPSAVFIARTNRTVPGQEKSPTPFGSLLAFDDLLTVGPEANSKVIGNARGMYVASSKTVPELVIYVDFGFTTGKFNGSSISVFSRNTIMDTERELAVVGGRGKFRMARGFAKLKTYSVLSNGDAIVEYNVTLFHY